MEQKGDAAVRDQAGFDDDGDEQPEVVLESFPSADDPGLIPASPPNDADTAFGTCGTFRFRSIRGMQDGLICFDWYPEVIPTPFQKLTDLYMHMMNWRWMVFSPVTTWKPRRARSSALGFSMSSLRPYANKK